MRLITGSLCFAALTIGGQAHASSQSGPASQLIPSDSGYGFRGSGTRTTKPACHTGAENQWFIDTSTPAGQAMAATVISAFYNGNTMNIFETDTCLPGQPNVEAVKTIQVIQ